MQEQDRMRIVSNDYADLLITYSGDVSLLNQFGEDATVNIVDFFNAVVHIPVNQFNENIIVERGYSVVPSLYGTISEASLEASGVTRLRAIPNFNLRGQGVLIGIIDTGVDYTNPIFQYADGTTRIVSIWDQTIQSDQFPRAGYGTLYSSDQINTALQSENPLEIVPSTDDIGHGTMLAGIAAGNPVPEAGFSGVAPDTELIVVKLKPAKPYLKEFFRVRPEVNAYQENDIIFGINYLIDAAFQLNRPIVICIGLGTSQGAHDGRGTLSSYLSLVASRSGVGVVVAAGNEGNARRHYYGTVNPNTGYDTFELNVGENEYGFSMEIWGNSPGIYTMDMLSPSGEYIPRMGVRLDETRVLSFIFETTIIHIDFQAVESQSGDQLILIRFRDPAPGTWTFRVYSSDRIDSSFHIWLPMEGFIGENTFFIRPDPYTTILSLGNSRVPITVTGYNDADNSLYLNASRGYTRTGVIKPEIAAPGVALTGPTLEQGFTDVTGTSASAAHTAGIAAMLMEWGIVRQNYIFMNTIVVKVFLMRGARRDEDIIYPNRDWGYGIVDAFNVFDFIRGDIRPQ